MVHPLNDLKDLKKARAEITRAKKAAAGAPVSHQTFEAGLSNVRAEIAPVLAAREAGAKKAQDPDAAFITRAELAIALGPILAALELTAEDYGVAEPEPDEEDEELELDLGERDEREGADS